MTSSRSACTRSNAVLISAALASMAAASAAQPIVVAPAAPEPVYYYDLATGVVSESDPRGGASGAVWLNNNTAPCAAGQLTNLIIDDPDLDSNGVGDTYAIPCGGLQNCEDGSLLWWGDIEPGTLIDRFVIRYVSQVPVGGAQCTAGSAVEGLDMIVSFFDANNDFQDTNRQCIIAFRVENLRGSVPCLGQVFPVRYTLVVDLGPGQAFTLGASPTDLDGDGLHDFAWSVGFEQNQPTRGPMGVVAAAPKLGNLNDLAPHPADASNVFDGAAAFATTTACTSLAYVNGFSLGGFSCDPGAQTPHTSGMIEFYGPNPPCQCGIADIAEPYCSLDFADVVAFLTAFSGGQNWVGNLAPPFASQAPPDFSDISAFLGAFGAGCP